MTRPRLLSVAEAAELMGISVQQVRKLAARGVVKGLPPTDWRINIESARAYAAQEHRPGRPRRETV